MALHHGPERKLRKNARKPSLSAICVRKRFPLLVCCGRCWNPYLSWPAREQPPVRRPDECSPARRLTTHKRLRFALPKSGARVAYQVRGRSASALIFNTVGLFRWYAQDFAYAWTLALCWKQWHSYSNVDNSIRFVPDTNPGNSILL